MGVGADKILGVYYRVVVDGDGGGDLADSTRENN